MKPHCALVPLGLALAALAPARAADPPAAQPGIEQAVLLRCSAAFAIVAGDQARGLPAARAYPPLAERGREFFVRASAQLMDELHLTHDQVRALLQEQVEQLQRESAQAKDRQAFVDQVMQPCLETLAASGV